VSIANNLENKILDAVFNGVDLPGQGTVYVKLHTGDPGEDCTGNAASDADITWTNVAATETYSHISIWDAVNAGNPLWYGALTASKAVTAGDTFTIPSASLTASLD
jgi:hypothetical protein